MKSMKLDVTAAFSGLLVGLLSLMATLYLHYGIGLATTIVMSCLTYLIVVQKRKNLRQQLLATESRTKRPFLVLFPITSGATIIFFLWSSLCFLYGRPFEYFIAAATLSTIIALEIGLLRPIADKFEIYNVLLQILLLAAALRWSSLFAFPGFIGVDPWGHSFGVQFILEKGHVYTAHDGLILNYNFIPSYTIEQYAWRPVMHILVSELQLVPSFPSIKYALTFSVGLFEIMSLLFVFTLTRRVFGDVRSAALASLLVGVSSWHIMWGFWIIPMTMGLSFFTLLLSLLPHLRSSNHDVCHQREILTLFLFVFAALVFTHTIASLIWLLFLCFVWIGAKMFRNYARLKRKETISTLLFLAIIIIAANWMFSYFIDGEIPFISASTTFEPLIPSIRSLAHFEVDNIGTYILYFLAIVGSLASLKRLSIEKVSIISGAVGLSIFTYGSVLGGFRAFLPERWMAFLFVILAPIAAVGYQFLGRFHSGGRKILLLLSMFVLTFSMIVSSNSNVDSPLYYPEEFGVRRSLTQSEIAAAQVATAISNDPLYVDESDVVLGAALRWSFKREIVGVDFKNFNPDDIDGLIVMRRNAYFQPTQPPTELSNTNRVYSNGQVEVFVRQGG